MFSYQSALKSIASTATSNFMLCLWLLRQILGFTFLLVLNSFGRARY